ncbi:unnamed protein product [Rhodiola kirilowii]
MSSSAIHPPVHSFLVMLSSTTYDVKQENAAIYVHPLVRKSSAKLSDKSLEMCTESLGNETGCDTTKELMSHRKETKIATKVKRGYKFLQFPPLLTSISDSVSVERHMENGRLIVNAVVNVETSSSLFHAKRVDGRLMLRLKKGDEEENESDETNGEEEEEWEEAERSVSWIEDLSGKLENAEGNIGIDDNISRTGKCNANGGEMGRKGDLLKCWVAI